MKTVLFEWAEKVGYSQAGLGRQLGYSRVYINQVSGGHLPVTLAFQARCALRLGNWSRFLFGREGEPLSLDGLDVVLVEFLGRQYGSITRKGKATGAPYHFSAFERRRWVPREDAEGFAASTDFRLVSDPNTPVLGVDLPGYSQKPPQTEFVVADLQFYARACDVCGRGLGTAVSVVKNFQTNQWTCESCWGQVPVDGQNAMRYRQRRSEA